MSYPTLASVNVGNATHPRGQAPAGLGHRQAPGARDRSTSVGSSLEGDEVGNAKEDHGGTYQAVYAFARRTSHWWTEQLGPDIRPGLFGENLTTRDLDLNGCVVGEQWLVGTARFQVTSVRTPCSTFQRWMGLHGFDNDQLGPSGSPERGRAGRLPLHPRPGLGAGG